MRASWFLVALLLGGCGSLTLDKRFRVFIDGDLGGIGPRALAAIQQALTQLQRNPDSVAQEVRIVADMSTKFDGYVDTGDRSTLYLAPQWINAYSDAATTDLHLRVLVAHELGHMLGQDGHLSCDGDQNIMAQNCLPPTGRYSAADIRWICNATTGGVCDGL